MNQQLVPKLRFPGFSVEWEEDEFSKIATLSRIKYDPIKASESYKDIELESLESQTGRIINFVDSKSQKSIKTRFQRGDVLYGKLRPYLKKYARAPFDGVCSSEIWVIRGSKCSNHFLYYLVQSPKFDEIVNMQTGSKMPRADWSFVGSGIFLLPGSNEQEKIAEFLGMIDERIAASDKKVKLLKQYKKGVMQKIFTQQIRFGDKDGQMYPDWETKKLGGLMEIGSSKRVLQKDWQQFGVPFYRTREVINLAAGMPFRTPIFITEQLYEELVRKYGVPRTGDILVTGVGSIGVAYLVDSERKFYFKDGNVLWFRQSDKIDPVFLYQSFKARFVQKQIEDNASITTVATFTIDGAKKIKIPLPHFEEQLKIANFLTVLDNRIKTEESKLEQAKTFKKSLLQRMFV